MAHADDHLTELLRLPAGERAKAARALLDSLDEAGEEGAEEAQLNELLRRVLALDAGKVELVDAAEARARVEAKARNGEGKNRSRDHQP